MSGFVYRPLDTQIEEIRLLELQPGQSDEPIVFKICYAALLPPPPCVDLSPSPRLSLEEVAKTLPEDWNVSETVEGRYIFIYNGPDEVPNTWDHPDPSFAGNLTELQITQSKSPYHPDYEALSYTWGDLHSRETAYVLKRLNEPMSPMPIGANLACALKYLRRPESSRTLWVDAVCINQDDITERNAQVARMGSIYSMASQVVVWLGERSSDSALALQTLQDLANQVELFTDNGWGDAPGAREPRWYASSCPLSYDEETWSALSRFFSRDWFTRVWVLQEVQLARSAIVQVSEECAPWNAIRKCILVLGRKVGIPGDLRRLISLHRHSIGARLTLTFPNLLYWSSHHKCLNPRDKLYGVLSLVPPDTLARIRPRYSDSPLKIFTDAFLAHLASTKRLELLRYCRIEQKVKDGPSWIPNWTIDTTRPGSRPTRNFLGQPAGFSAAHARLIAPQTLQVMGAYLARVNAVMRLPSNISAATLESIRKWRLETLGSDNVSGQGTSLDTFIKTLYRRRFKERWPASHLPTFSDVRHAWTRNTSGGSAEPLLLDHLEAEELEGSTLFYTDTKLPGLALADAQIGDLVCVLMGCDRLLVLRPDVQGGHALVGSTYMDSFMDGEGLLGPLSPSWTVHMADIDGCLIPQYFNRDTNDVVSEDPRLPALESQWQVTARKRTQDDPYYFQDVRNVDTKERLNSDPRMLPEKLTVRGTKLKMFKLV